MKRMLYVMHICWGWIKQRPQFLAEGLAAHFDVDLYYRKSNHTGKGLNPCFERQNLRVKGFRNLPIERLSFVPYHTFSWVNTMLWDIKNVDLSRYDYIWLTDPMLFPLVLNQTHRAKLVYDCMDDSLSFPYVTKYPQLKEEVRYNEEQLLQMADYVFCSADSLREKLTQRYHLQRNCYVINNAIAEITPHLPEKNEGKKSSQKGLYAHNEEISLPENSFVYIGTVSEWFDFKLILETLERYRDIHVVLYGPVRMSNPPRHPRLWYQGTIAHDKTSGVMRSATALIMPFKLNELVLSVNPVKLYEYICSGKPIAAVRYGETEKFGNYVSLYASREEFFSFVEATLEGKNRHNEATIRKMTNFARLNTWNKRVDAITNILQ